MAAPVTEFQILSQDPNRTAAFYSELFDWTVDANNAMGYRRIDTGSREGIQGGIWPAPPQAPSFVQLFVAVEDVTAAVDKAVRLGARILIPVTSLPEGDEIAILHDPEGMSFGLCRRRTATASCPAS